VDDKFGKLELKVVQVIEKNEKIDETLNGLSERLSKLEGISKTGFEKVEKTASDLKNIQRDVARNEIYLFYIIDFHLQQMEESKKSEEGLVANLTAEFSV